MCILNLFSLNCTEKNSGIDIAPSKWILALASNPGL